MTLPVSNRVVLVFVLALLAPACTDGKLDVLKESASTGTLESPFVLDDFEDGNTQSLSIPGGYWYFQPDSTCTGLFGVELVSGRPGNTHAIRARSAGGCTDWGALLGLDIGMGESDTFDASSFDELRFWARAEPGSFTELSVSLLEPAHWDTPIEITNDWRELVLPLDGFMLNDAVSATTFNTDTLTHLQFFVFSAEPFDFWLDDLAFVRSE